MFTKRRRRLECYLNTEMNVRAFILFYQKVLTSTFPLSVIIPREKSSRMRLIEAFTFFYHETHQLERNSPSPNQERNQLVLCIIICN